MALVIDCPVKRLQSEETTGSATMESSTTTTKRLARLVAPRFESPRTRAQGPTGPVGVTPGGGVWSGELADPVMNAS